MPTSHRKNREAYRFLDPNKLKNCENDREFFNYIKLAQSQLLDVLQLTKPWDQLTDEEKKIYNVNSNRYEIFLIVDENDKILRDHEGLPVVEFRKNCHIAEHKEYNIHRSAGFIITNQNGEILLSKRSETKDKRPGYIEIGGGHLGIQQNYKKTAIREIGEELNIQPDEIKQNSKIMKFLYESKSQKQFMEFYEIQIKPGTQPTPDQEEVEESNFYSPEKILKFIKNGEIKLVPLHKWILLRYLESKGLTIPQKLFEHIDYELENDGSNISKLEKII